MWNYCATKTTSVALWNCRKIIVYFDKPTQDLMIKLQSLSGISLFGVTSAKPSDSNKYGQI